MLGVTLLCVGKLKEPFLKAACDEYVKRLSAYCKLEIFQLSEERLSQAPPDGEIARGLEKEAAAILAKIPTGAYVIPLCIEGKALSSEDFAEKIGALQLGGQSRLCLIIGGSFGLSETVKSMAALRLSMSKMTFPHHFARVMLLEQLYRSFQILASGKYHK